MAVNFLIVAALRDEAAAIERLLLLPEPLGEYVVGKVKRAGEQGYYTVGIVNLYDGMGSLHAGPVTQQAITTLQPSAVLMTGIAAGFEEAQAAVQLGDLMIPYGVVPYELAKLVGANKELDTPATVQHRGIAWAVSESLWRTAANVAQDLEQPWISMISAARPEGAASPPKIHAIPDSVIGCGDKIVADEEAEVRQWLLNTYPRQVLGLEMESFPALRACRILDTPFVVAKASVDKATLAKDDRWRVYSCELSAAFLLSIVKHYERPRGELHIQHLRDCDALAETIAKNNSSRPDFQYRIRTAGSFTQLRRGTFNDGEEDRRILFPNSMNPTVVLYAGGGMGKSTVVQQLMVDILGEGQTPVLLDLKRFSQEYDETAADEGIDAIVKVASSPRRTTVEIEQLAAQGKLVLSIDGVNEVSKKALSQIISFCRDLRRGPGCLSLWTTRMTAIEGIKPEPRHATITNIPADVAEKCFNDRFGQGAYDSLSLQLQQIYQRPFFLDLAIRSNETFATKRLWSEIFLEFFKAQLSFTDEQLDEIAQATRDAIGPDGHVRIDKMKRAVSQDLWERLHAAQVGVVDDTNGFAHHLWRDYLVARSLKSQPSFWMDRTFDSVTGLGTSIESLVMAVEQIAGSVERAAFIAAVYDWNYRAALECIALSEDEADAGDRIPSALRIAVLAVVGEKKFDAVERTRERTEKLLSQYAFAKEYMEFSTREAMVEHVQRHLSDDAWSDWLRLYSLQGMSEMPMADLMLVASENSLIGWTAANLAHRSTISDEGVVEIRRIYETNLGATGRRSVRWRAVHVLGGCSSERALELLARALGDEYHWVQYGAVRSLAETASRSQSPHRQKALELLSQFVASDAGGEARGYVLEQIVESCFVNNAEPLWGENALPLLERVLDRVPSELRSNIALRVATFREHYVGPSMAPTISASTANSSL